MEMCVNLLGATIRMESSMSMRLGYALSKDIQFEACNMMTLNNQNIPFVSFSFI